MNTRAHPKLSSLAFAITGILLLVFSLPHFMSPVHAASSSAKFALNYSSNNDVLFIHGFAGGNSNGSSNGVDCRSLWQTTETFLENQGWPSHKLITIGYYGKDANCTNNLTTDDYQSGCLQYLHHGPIGTNNEDLWHVACDLAWYIYDNYTMFGLNAQVVAHSMGGVLIRAALDGVSNHRSGFPSLLKVTNVITIASPLGGVPNVIIATGIGLWASCKTCQQALDLVNNSSFMTTLLAETAPPQVATTSWTEMASPCDQFLQDSDPGVDISSALNFPGGLKIYYYDVSGAANNLWHTCTDPYDNTTDYSYYHGDYLRDIDTAIDAGVWVNQNRTFIPYGGGDPYPHAINEIYRVLAQCGGSDCTGLDPVTNHCANDLQLVNSTIVVSGFSSNLYYSRACDAYWVQGNSSSPRAVTLNIAGNNSVTYATSLSTTYQGSTPMVGGVSSAQACGHYGSNGNCTAFSQGGQIPVEERLDPTCIGGCTGKDAGVSNCGEDAQLLNSTAITSTFHADLYYSHFCDAYWTHARSTSPISMTINIGGINGVSYATSFSSTYEGDTPMVAGVSSGQACGHIGSSSNCTAFTVHP